MKKLILLIRLFQLIFLTISINSHLFAENKIYAINPEWPGFYESEGNGIIVEILKAVYEKNGYQVVLEVAPYKRANIYVKKGYKDVLFGLYSMEKRRGLGMKVKTFSPEYPYSVEKTVAIYKKGYVINWKGLESLKRQSVAAIRGYDYDKVVPFPMDYNEVNKHAQYWDMLRKGRVSFVLDDYIDVLPFIKDNKIDLSRFEIKTVLVENLYPAFTMNDRGKKLAAIYDKEMASLISKGVISQLYKNGGYEPPDLNPEK